MYEFKNVDTGKIKAEESLINAYSEEIHESEQFHNSTKVLHILFDAK